MGSSGLPLDSVTKARRTKWQGDLILMSIASHIHCRDSHVHNAAIPRREVPLKILPLLAAQEHVPSASRCWSAQGYMRTYLVMKHVALHRVFPQPMLGLAAGGHDVLGVWLIVIDDTGTQERRGDAEQKLQVAMNDFSIKARLCLEPVEASLSSQVQHMEPDKHLAQVSKDGLAILSRNAATSTTSSHDGIESINGSTLPATDQMSSEGASQREIQLHLGHDPATPARSMRPFRLQSRFQGQAALGRPELPQSINETGVSPKLQTVSITNLPWGLCSLHVTTNVW